MTLMEQFTNPETMHALSFGDKMLASFITMIMGMGITFLVLVILWAFITIMGKVLGLVNKPKTKAAKPAAAAAPAAAAKKAPAGSPDDEVMAAVIAAAIAASEDVIPAVIAAAIAAYEAGSGIPNNLVVKKIRRIPSNTTLWSDAARDDVIDTRRF